MNAKKIAAAAAAFAFTAAVVGILPGSANANKGGIPNEKSSNGATQANANNDNSAHATTTLAP